MHRNVKTNISTLSNLSNKVFASTECIKIMQFKRLKVNYSNNTELKYDGFKANIIVKILLYVFWTFNLIT